MKCANVKGDWLQLDIEAKTVCVLDYVQDILPTVKDGVMLGFGLLTAIAILLVLVFVAQIVILRRLPAKTSADKGGGGRALSVVLLAGLMAGGLMGCASTPELDVELGVFRDGLVPVAGIVDEHESERKVLLKCRKAAITGFAPDVQIVGKETESDTTKRDYGAALDDERLGAVVGLFAPSASSESSTDFKREDLNEEQRIAFFRLCIEENGYELATFVKGYKPVIWSEHGWNYPRSFKKVMEGEMVDTYYSGSPLAKALETQPCEDWVAECPGDGRPVEAE